MAYLNILHFTFNKICSHVSTAWLPCVCGTTSMFSCHVMRFSIFGSIPHSNTSLIEDPRDVPGMGMCQSLSRLKRMQDLGKIGIRMTGISFGISVRLVRTRIRWAPISLCSQYIYRIAMFTYLAVGPNCTCYPICSKLWLYVYARFDTIIRSYTLFVLTHKSGNRKY